MARKKKANQLMQSSNGLIAELADVKWIKQPVVYSLISGDFSLMQMNIIVAFAKAVQERIDYYLSEMKANGKESGTQLSLFSKEELSKEAITIKIDLASLGIRPDMYNDLETACESLIQMNMSYPVYGKDKKIKERVYANLFSRISIPADRDGANGNRYAYKGGKRRKGTIDVTVLTKNLADVFDMSHGYVNHIAAIAQFCKKKRTPRIYIYLERWRNYGYKTVNFIEFKEYLGLLRYDRNTNTVKDEVYPAYWEFCQKVLDPVKKEMDKLSAKNMIDISFDYEPVYRGARKRGNPDEIKFIIHLSSMGKQLTQQNKSKKELNSIIEHLKKEYSYSDADLLFLTEDWNDSLLPALEKEVLRLKENEERYKPKNPAGYALVSLRKFVAEHKPSVEEVVEVKEETPTPVVAQQDLPSKEDLVLFDKVLSVIKEHSFEIYTKIFNYLKLVGVQRNEGGCPKLLLAVPTKFFYEEIEINHLELFREALYKYFPDATVDYDINKSYYE